MLLSTALLSAKSNLLPLWTEWMFPVPCSSISSIPATGNSRHDLSFPVAQKITLSHHHICLWRHIVGGKGRTYTFKNIQYPQADLCSEWSAWTTLGHGYSCAQKNLVVARPQPRNSPVCTDWFATIVSSRKVTLKKSIPHKRANYIKHFSSVDPIVLKIKT